MSLVHSQATQTICLDFADWSLDEHSTLIPTLQLLIFTFRTLINGSGGRCQPLTATGMYYSMPVSALDNKDSDNITNPLRSHTDSVDRQLSFSYIVIITDTLGKNTHTQN